MRSLPILLLFFLDSSAFILDDYFLGRSQRRSSVPALGYYVPAQNGGSELTQVVDTYPPGLGEPLNAILSANSHPAVLIDQQTNGGFRNWLFSIQMAGECLGQHLGDNQAANLGDGNGYLNETAVIRWDYGDPYLGTCKETVQGGNHFRYWTQNGDQADSGAIFMACSAEQPIAEGHNIIVNGYNLSRDWVVGNATGQVIPTGSVQNGSTFIGSTVYGGYTYQTTAIYITGLLQNTSDGINHFQSVPLPGQNAIDGLVAVLYVNITDAPAGNTTSGGWRSTPAESPILSTMLFLGYLLVWTIL